MPVEQYDFVRTLKEIIDRELHDRSLRTSHADAVVFQKAQSRGQQTFTLVAQDYSAPLVIMEWIKLNVMTAPPEKLVDALLDAIAMREYQPKKRAD